MGATVEDVSGKLIMYQNIQTAYAFAKKKFGIV